MKEIEKYKIGESDKSKKNYLFDKLTCFLSKKGGEIKSPKKILLVRNDHLGDMVYSTPVFRELKRTFPKTKIVVLATGSNKELIEKDKNVDEIFEIDLFWRRGLKGFLDYLKILKKIKREKFDIGIDLRSSKLNMFFFLFLPRIKNRIAYYNLDGGKGFLTHPILYDKKMNFMKEHHTNLINKSLKIQIKNPWPDISVSEEDKKQVKNLMKKNKIKEYIVIAPGATTESKKWPKKKFEEVIKIFNKKHPKYHILISGAKSDETLIKNLCKYNKKICIPLINFNLRGMFLIFKSAKVVIANDGVGTDLSWISGGNLIELAGPVDTEIYRPLKNAKILQHKVSCYPCNWQKKCEKPCGIWCMDLISVEEVMKAINDFIKSR